MNSGIEIIVIIAVVILAGIRIGQIQRKRQEAAFRKCLSDRFGKAPEKTMSPERYRRLPAFYLRHLPEDPLDDITWNDLDMDAVYHRIDSTQCAAGEEYLYALLRSPVPGENSAKPIPLDIIRSFEEDDSEDHQNVHLRLMIQTALHRFGHMNRWSLYDYLDRLDEVEPESNWKHAPAFILPVLSIIVLVLNVPAGVLCLILSVILNMASYYHAKGKIDPYIATMAYLLRMMKCADDLCTAGIQKVMPEEGARLSEIQRGFAGLRRGSGILVSGYAVSGGSPAGFILDYIRILFHLDLIKFNSMLTDIRQKRKEIDEELAIIGRIDTAIALASFEKSLPHTCVPQFTDHRAENRDDNRSEKWKILAGEENTLSWPADSNSRSAVRLHNTDDINKFVIDQVYHPLLKDPVPNSMTAQRSVLLTGSNASGKSTFLKTVAICALFAQTLGFCPAASYEAPHFRIRSSMALRDNLLNGESYFMVEIRSLKRIADLSEDGGLPVLCFIDEVLRGTNTVERIAASSVILETLAERGVLCFAATHDIELTDLLKGCYDNYHFEEELGSEDVVFSYKLKDGPAATRNAIRLLEMVGFDQDITRKAEERAEQFAKERR